MMFQEVAANSSTTGPPKQAIGLVHIHPSDRIFKVDTYAHPSETNQASVNK